MSTRAAKYDRSVKAAASRQVAPAYGPPVTSALGRINAITGKVNGL